MLDPASCRCDIKTISYEQVKEGTIWCRACGRIWDLTEHGWKPDPSPAVKKWGSGANPGLYGRNKRRRVNRVSNV